MEKILEDVVKKIKAKIRERGMTQKDFSLKMGKNENWLTVLPFAQNDIKVKDLIKACRILKVEPSYLLEDNFSHNICDMNIEDLIKMLVKRECDDYLKKETGNLARLLNHIRDKDNA